MSDTCKTLMSLCKRCLQTNWSGYHKRCKKSKDYVINTTTGMLKHGCAYMTEKEGEIHIFIL